MRKSRAQSTLEYATIITIVIGALTVMSTYVQRAIQANLKVIENQINGQPGNEVNCKLPIKQDSGGSTSTGTSTGSASQQNPFCEIIVKQPQNEPEICQAGPFSSDVPPIENSQSALISAVPVENSNEPVPCQGVPYNAATGIPSEDMPLVPESDSESTQIQEQVNSNLPISVGEPVIGPEQIYQGGAYGPNTTVDNSQSAAGDPYTGSSSNTGNNVNEPIADPEQIYQGVPYGPSVPNEIKEPEIHEVIPYGPGNSSSEPSVIADVVPYGANTGIPADDTSNEPTIADVSPYGPGNKNEPGVIADVIPY